MHSGAGGKLGLCHLKLLMQAAAIYKVYQDAFPGAEILASTFDSYIIELEKAMPSLSLPTYSGEIGDSWIYGDPLNKGPLNLVCLPGLNSQGNRAAGVSLIHLG